MNAGKDTIVTIMANSTPSNVLLYITGEVDDSFMVNGAAIKGGRLNNDTVWLDWYDKTVNIHYYAYKAKKGRLFFKYNIP
jgi:hypothetical protein